MACGGLRWHAATCGGMRWLAATCGGGGGPFGDFRWITVTCDGSRSRRPILRYVVRGSAKRKPALGISRMSIALVYRVYSYILTGLAALTEPNPIMGELKTQYVEVGTHKRILFFCRLRLLGYAGFLR